MKRVVLNVLAGAFIVAALTACGGSGASSSPSNVADKWLSALVKKDYTTAAKYSSYRMESEETKAKYLERMLTAEGEVSILKYKIKEEQKSVDGKKATVFANWTVKLGSKEREDTIDIPLIKTEDDGWKVDFDEL